MRGFLASSLRVHKLSRLRPAQMVVSLALKSLLRLHSSFHQPSNSPPTATLRTENQSHPLLWDNGHCPQTACLAP
jgi:hypothetical protein